MIIYIADIPVLSVKQTPCCDVDAYLNISCDTQHQNRHIAGILRGCATV